MLNSLIACACIAVINSFYLFFTVIIVVPGLTVLALVLPGGLRCSQAHQLLRGFWVNYGGVAALQVFCDGSRVTVVVMVTLQEEDIELGDVQTLC